MPSIAPRATLSAVPEGALSINTCTLLRISPPATANTSAATSRAAIESAWG